MTELHSAGHRRGVVAAPHAAAAEAGRAVLAEGGNALEAMVAMAASHRRGLSAHEPHRRRRLLAGPRAERPRCAPSWRRVRPARGHERELYREHDAIPPRGPLAALTVPGAIGGWMLALEAAKALGGQMPLDVLLARRSARRATAMTVTKSQARLTAEKLAELKDVPGFAATFLPDGKPPRGRHHAEAERACRDARSSGARRPRRFLPRRRRTRDRRRSGADRQPGDARRPRALPRHARPSRLSVELDAGTIYNTPPPTQGLASLIILALYERLRVAEAESFEFAHGLVEATKRAFRVRDRVVTDPGAGAAAAGARFSMPKFLDAEVRRSTAARPRNGRRPTAKATRSGWARPMPAGSSCPTSSRSIGSSARAACCRRPAC